MKEVTEELSDRQECNTVDEFIARFFPELSTEKSRSESDSESFGTNLAQESLERFKKLFSTT
jgi:hypothetical protein